MSLPTAGQTTAAAIGKGATLGYFVGTGTPTFVIAAEVLDIKMPKHTASPIPVQRYDSPSLFEELITGWAKAGDLEIQLTYNAPQGAAIYAMFNVFGQFQVTKPDATTWTYKGILTEFGDELPLKDKMVNSFKFSISGSPTPSTTSA